MADMYHYLIAQTIHFTRTNNNTMNTIFCIDDCTTDTINALQFAIDLACTTHSRLLIGVTKASVPAKGIHAGMGIDHRNSSSYEEAVDARIQNCLKALDCRQNAFSCAVKEVNIPEMSAVELARFINGQGISVIIKSAEALYNKFGFDNQQLLNKVLVPLLLIPARPVKLPAQMVYMADLRYCRTDLLSSLLDLTALLNTRISIAHLSMPGLPDLTSDYALELFSEMCKLLPDSDRLFLHHISDQPISRVADVLINAMKHECLVMANHSAHYRRLIEERTLMNEPGLVGTPLLLYPG
jgi:hypothetical protein